MILEDPDALYDDPELADPNDQCKANQYPVLFCQVIPKIGHRSDKSHDRDEGANRWSTKRDSWNGPDRVQY